MADYQAIVIGSGAGGLSAALALSRSGSSVLLLEAMPSFGGYLNPFGRKPYTFDTGRLLRASKDCSWSVPAH